ncbi:MAG: S1 RNA-binding domain-containing protein [Myxococcales bacterium]|nr:S1 RNA-binding domain-containing protein [Myxococcales bacterium]
MADDEPAPSRATPLAPEDFPSTDDFAAMLGAGPLGVRSYDVGDKVTGTVVAIGNDAVFVALGGKTEGAIDSAELLDRDGQLTVSVGDSLEAYVVTVRGGVRLSRALGKGGGEHLAILEDAARQGIPVEGRVTGVNKGGFDVQALGARGFCPFSQIDLGSGAEPETWIGQTLAFLVTRVEEGGRNVVLSRSALLRRERDERAGATLETLRPGLELDGVVTRVADFGAFVDIGGVDGLVHVSELSWGRVDHPSELVNVGDRVRVSVVSLSDLDDAKHRRIALSMRALAEDPWFAATRDLHPGSTATGRVTRLERFGAFVELAPGVEGLVHISEIDPGRRLKHPKDALDAGAEVQVQVLQVDPQKRQIALSIKALLDDPWTELVARFPPGTAVQGTVESVQSFGVFVALAAGVTALLPLGNLPEDEARNAYTRFRQGTAVEARVTQVDVERRRISLSRRPVEDDDGGRAFQAHKTQQPEKLGTFADLLRRR